jgi:hypothetical protein
VKPTLVLLLIGSSLLAACQSGQAGRQPFHDDGLCSLRAITVSEEVRAYLRAPLQDGVLPAGYARFLRDIAAHNAKIRVHCGPD